MVESVETLKEFILWCKNQKIAKIKLKDVEVEFVPWAWSEKMEDSYAGLTPQEIEDHKQKEHEDLMFHSA